MDWLLRDASQAYAVVYFGVIILLALVEPLVPRREPGDALRLRWFGNFALSIIGTAVARLIVPVAGVALALLCERHGWGLFHLARVPRWLQYAVTILVLDFVGYAQHYLLHRVPLLWRLHRTHHSDHDYDFSTGARFHPIETVFTTAILVGAVGILGAPPAAVLLSQLISTVIGFWEHGNLRIAATFDHALRLVVVTPDMHRIHHSRDGGDSRMNYGGTFTWWDRLFGTYRVDPAAGHEQMAFGVEGFETQKYQTLPWMLIQPLAGDDGSVRLRASRYGETSRPDATATAKGPG